MSRPPSENLQTTTEEVSEEREVYLRDGRKLVLSEQHGDQLVEIRNESGMLEVRIRLTEEGPVLQMESARLSLKATESIEIESKRVEIKGAEKLELKGGQVEVTGEQNEEAGTNGEIKVVGSMIYLN
jgi:hypothetical protein